MCMMPNKMSRRRSFQHSTVTRELGRFTTVGGWCVTWYLSPRSAVAVDPKAWIGLRKRKRSTYMQHAFVSPHIRKPALYTAILRLACLVRYNLQSFSLRSYCSKIWSWTRNLRSTWLNYKRAWVNYFFFCSFPSRSHPHIKRITSKQFHLLTRMLKQLKIRPSGYLKRINQP